MAGKRGGRPSKLTPTAKKKIVAAVRDGTPFKFAALAAGVTARTFQRWMKAGRARKNRDVMSLLSAVKKAESAGVAGLVRGIRRAGDKQWQALSWILERRFPDEFGLNRGELKRLAKLIEEQTKEIASLKARVPDERPHAGPTPEPQRDGNAGAPPPAG